MPSFSVPPFESAVLTSYPSSTDAPVTISDESAVAKTLIRSDRAQFGVPFGSSVMVGDALVCGTRPDEWLILGTVDASAAVDSGGFTSIIPFTHGRSLFRLSGDDTPGLLEKVCGLDWSDNMTPDGAVVTASVALVTCDIIRTDQDGQRSYLVMCDRSFGQYLFDALIDAGTEFGIAVQ